MINISKYYCTSTNATIQAWITNEIGLIENFVKIL